MSIDERLRHLELELTKLKRRNKGLLAAMAVLSVAMTFAFVLMGPLGGAQAQNGGQVVAREILLVDEEGNIRVHLWASHGGSSLTLAGEDGTSFALLSTEGDGSSLALAGEDGVIRAHLFAKGDESLLTLKDARGRGGLQLSVNSWNSDIGFYDNNDVLRATMGHMNLDSAPHLTIFDEKGIPLWSAPE